MASTHLAPTERSAVPILNVQQQMMGVTTSFESLRKLLKEEKNWSEAEAIDRLNDLVYQAAGFAQRLKERQEALSQNRGRKKVGAYGGQHSFFPDRHLGESLFGPG